MSEPLCDIRAHVCPDAHAVLAAVAATERRDLSDIVRMVIERWALGAVHDQTVAARVLERGGITGKGKDRA